MNNGMSENNLHLSDEVEEVRQYQKVRQAPGSDEVLRPYWLITAEKLAWVLSKLWSLSTQ